MIFLFVAAVFIANGGSAQLIEDGCDPRSQLQICVDMVPRTPIGLPRTKEELDAHCHAYNTGMTCMDAWMKRCLPNDGQKIVQKQIGGARMVMRFLCNETALRRDYLKEPTCWAVVSPDWSHCVDELQFALRDISGRLHRIVYFQKNVELCCARDAFMSCVATAGRACSDQAAGLLRRLAWVLAQDVATCIAQPQAHCAASWPQLTTPLLTALTLSALYFTLQDFKY